MAGNILTTKLQDDLKTAMKAKDKLRVSTMRMLINEMKNAQLDERGEELPEAKEIAILTSYAKKRRESIKSYEEGGREDLAESERQELEIVMDYLPEQMSEDDIRAEIVKAVAEMGASGPQDMGKVMGPLMGKFKGRADGSVVKTITMEILRGGKG
jgi:uncharacterized protein YqeY